MSRRNCQFAFLLYAGALFIATHWPDLKIEGAPIERPDLIIHAGVFAMWFVLLMLSGFAGPACSRASVIRAAAIASVYAALDEGLQAIPWVHRHAAWDDLAANLTGICAATITWFLLASYRLHRGRHVGQSRVEVPDAASNASRS